ncbi:hypothetical protein M885DRAFT_622841 [Pelagophyceae sp. CCMP2097]|nr:hypothetical protein M885DRAFT_622841 [Pelagophyceae sp. CCMP2097]
MALVVEVVRITGLPPRMENSSLEMWRSPYLQVHLESAAGSPLSDFARGTSSEPVSPVRSSSSDDGEAAPPQADVERRGMMSMFKSGSFRTTKLVMQKGEAPLADDDAPVAAPASAVQVSVRQNTLNPVWHVHVRVAPCGGFSELDYLVVHVDDASLLTRTHRVGRVRVDVAQLEAHAKPFAVELLNARHRVSATCELWLRRVILPAPLSPPRLRSVNVVLLRHGESAWNEAQAESDFRGMILKRDHPLTAAGIRQAARFNGKWKRAANDAFATTLDAAGPAMQEAAPFKSVNLGPLEPPDRDDAEADGELDPTAAVRADDAESLALLFDVTAVWASPLTRAVQTALVACDGLEALTRGVSLHAECREIKGVGGFDCVGLECGGDAIRARAADELARELLAGRAAARNGVSSSAAAEAVSEAAARMAAAQLAAPPLAERDAKGQWWTGTAESAGEVSLRYGEFARALQFETLQTRHKSPLVSGHSLFFRGLFERYLDDGWAAEHPNDAVALKTRKLVNAGAVSVRIDFDDFGEAPMAISEPKLLFGSDLEKLAGKGGGRRAPAFSETAYKATDTLARASTEGLRLAWTGSSKLLSFAYGGAAAATSAASAAAGRKFTDGEARAHDAPARDAAAEPAAEPAGGPAAASPDLLDFGADSGFGTESGPDAADTPPPAPRPPPPAPPPLTSL